LHSVWNGIRTPEYFASVINLKTAKGIELEVPLQPQQRATEFVE
jgi:hypothetical protein